MACLRVIDETFLSETSRFYCISGALRGLGFQNFPDSPPPRRLIPLAFATTPRSENAYAVPGHRMTSHIFTISRLHARQESPPPSGKFSSTALGAAIVIY